MILEPEIPNIVEEENKVDSEIVAAQQNAEEVAASPGADSKASPKGG